MGEWKKWFNLKWAIIYRRKCLIWRKNWGTLVIISCLFRSGYGNTLLKGIWKWKLSTQVGCFQAFRKHKHLPLAKRYPSQSDSNLFKAHSSLGGPLASLPKSYHMSKALLVLYFSCTSFYMDASKLFWDLLSKKIKKYKSFTNQNIISVQNFVNVP